MKTQEVVGPQDQPDPIIRGHLPKDVSMLRLSAYEVVLLEDEEQRVWPSDTHRD